MSLSKQILAGVLVGVVVGLFLGDLAAPFGYVATAFVKLLQITVLPYMTVSIVLNLGRLDYAQARTLGLRASSALLGFWSIALSLGYDVDLAHQLARDLGVLLELVPVDRARLAAALESGSCDVVMAGIAVTAERAEQLLFSSSYMDETLAFIVPDHLRERFADWQTIRERADLEIAAERAVLSRQAAGTCAPSANRDLCRDRVRA